MTAAKLTEDDIAALAEPLLLMVDRLDAGELTAGPLALSYLRGALAALEALAAGAPVDVPDDLIEPTSLQ